MWKVTDTLGVLGCIWCSNFLNILYGFDAITNFSGSEKVTAISSRLRLVKAFPSTAGSVQNTYIHVLVCRYSRHLMVKNQFHTV